MSFFILRAESRASSVVGAEVRSEHRGEPSRSGGSEAPQLALATRCPQKQRNATSFRHSIPAVQSIFAVCVRLLNCTCSVGVSSFRHHRPPEAVRDVPQRSPRSLVLHRDSGSAGSSFKFFYVS